MTVQAVGVTDRYGSNHGVALYLALTAVTDGVASGNMAQLQDRRLQRGYGVENAVVTGIDAVEAKSEATHVHLALREVLDAGRVVHVAQDLMAVGRL